MWRNRLRLLVLAVTSAAVSGAYRAGAADGPASVADRLQQYGPAARERLKPEFAKAGVAYPPRELVFVGLKREHMLEVWARGDAGRLRWIVTYPILAASGGLGPKLREGDGQVPEGIYGIELLNPNSRFHLSLRLNYPNAVDRRHAQADGRTRLGGDIMIHGNRCSIGCLAMGDPAAEDLFVLAADTGLHHITVILSPLDFRVRELPPGQATLPAWTEELYRAVREALARCK